MQAVAKRHRAGKGALKALKRASRLAKVIELSFADTLKNVEVQCAGLAKEHRAAKASLKSLRKSIKPARFTEEPWLDVSLDGVHEPFVTELNADGSPMGKPVSLNSLESPTIKLRASKAINLALQKGRHHVS